jgi:hypothetical protein
MTPQAEKRLQEIRSEIIENHIKPCCQLFIEVHRMVRANAVTKQELEEMTNDMEGLVEPYLEFIEDQVRAEEASDPFGHLYDPTAQQG